MKKFLALTIFYSLLLITVISFPAVSQKSFFFFTNNNFYFPKQFNDAFILKKQKPLVILGNSKSLSSLSNKIISKELGLDSYHLGYSSSSPENAYYTLSSYLSKNSIPRYVVMEVSWFSFSNKRVHTHKKHLMETFHYQKNKLPNVHDFTMGFYIDYAMRFYKNRKPKQYNKSYADRFQKVSNKKIEVNELNFNKIFPNGIAGIDSKYLIYFYRIIELVNKHKIHLVLFTSPESEDFVIRQKNRIEILDLYKKLANQNENIFYLNFAPRGKYFNPKFQKLLSDSHHLSNPNLFSLNFAGILLNESIIMK